MPNDLDPERIAESEEMKRCTRIGADADVEIELLPVCDLERSSKVQQVSRSSVFGEVTGVLNKHIPRSCQLPIEQERGLAS